MDPLSLLTCAAILTAPAPIAAADLVPTSPTVPTTTALILGLAQDADAAAPAVDASAQAARDAALSGSREQKYTPRYTAVNGMELRAKLLVPLATEVWRTKSKG